MIGPFIEEFLPRSVLGLAIAVSVPAAAVAWGLWPEAPLCVAGHPAPRGANADYAGLPPRSGMQRDHIVPLCLGGTDTSDNVRYQPLAEARIKDAEEWQYCETYCRGEISLYAARRHFLQKWGLKNGNISGPKTTQPGTPSQWPPPAPTR